MRVKAALKTSIYYLVVVLISFTLYCIVRYTRNKLNSVRVVHILTIEYLIIKYLSIFLVCILFILMISITKTIYTFNLNNETINYISKKNSLSTRDLRVLLKIQYANIEFKMNPIINLLLQILGLFSTFAIYFLSIFLIERFFFHFNIEKYNYIAILSLWTLIFTAHFYLFYNKFFDTENKKVNIYILLLLLYIVALLAKENFFFNLIQCCKPYNNECLNVEFQYIIYEYIIKYTAYITDWSLIQGIVLAILIYYDWGSKRQSKYENKKIKKQKEYIASLRIIKMIEEIYQNSKFKDYCLNITKYLDNDNYLFIDKITLYNKHINSICKDIEVKNLSWLLRMYSLEFLSDNEFVENIAQKASIKKIAVCNSCKQLFFPEKKELFCKNCQNHKKIVL